MKQSYRESHIVAHVFTNETVRAAVIVLYTVQYNFKIGECCSVHHRDRWKLLCSSERQVDAAVFIKETS